MDGRSENKSVIVSGQLQELVHCVIKNTAVFLDAGFTGDTAVDTYDFSGKTVIPFSTHGGSSFAGTPATIQSLEPGAKMLDGLTISRNNIQDAEQEIVSWVNGLDY